MTNVPITMVRGDTLALNVTMEDATPTSMYFSAKRDYKDEAYAFQKSMEDGITLISAGKYRVRVAPEDTEDLAVGKYVYDLQVGVGSDIYTVIGGTLKLENDVTRDDDDE